MRRFAGFHSVVGLVGTTPGGRVDPWCVGARTMVVEVNVRVRLRRVAGNKMGIDHGVTACTRKGIVLRKLRCPAEHVGR